MANEEQARDVKRRHSAELLRLPGVCGVGVQKNEAGDFYLALHLNTNDPQITAQLPKEIEGLAVQAIHSGPFQKLGSSEPLTREDA
jgi:hypothetical protein